LAHTTIHFFNSFWIDCKAYLPIFELMLKFFTLGSVWWNCKALRHLLYPQIEHLPPIFSIDFCFRLILLLFT